MFPERGETKLDLANYYVAVGDALMGTVRDRPTLLQRWPNGVTGQNFFQKRIPDSAPDWLETTTVATVNGTESRAIVMADLAHVLWAANQGCLGFHPWPYRASDPDDIDELRIDLDPSPGTTFEMVREAAAEVRVVPRRARHHGVPEDDRQPRAAPVRPRRARLGLLRHPPGRGQRGAGDGAPTSRADHRAVVEGAARRADLHRLQPERPAQDGVRRLVRAGPRRRPGVDAVPLGRAGDDPSRRSDDGDGARRVRRATAIRGRRWTTPPQSIEPLVARYRDDLARGIPDAPWPPVYPKMPDEARRVNPSRARPD